VCAKSQFAEVEVAMILIYGDDSADEKKERVSAVAVVYGSGKAWKWIQPKWKARNGKVSFHARNCESDRGDYSDVPHEKNKALYKELVTLIAKSDIGGFGIVFDLAAQKRVFPDSLDLAYYIAFTFILERMLTPAVHFRQLSKFTFDISTENEYNAGLIYQNFRENNPNAKRFFVREIAFGHAKESVRLQVADLVAFECMKFMDNAVGPVKRPVRASWSALASTERFGCICYSENWFKGLKADLANLEQKLGFNQADYFNWLNNKNRHHDNSNLFRFGDAMQKRILGGK
jgi:hypothetical protein